MSFLGSASSGLGLVVSAFLLSPPASAQQPAAGGASLEYRAGFFYGIQLLEIDGRQLDPWKQAKCKGVGCRTIALAPGPHRVSFVTDGTVDVRPPAVEFEAAPGTRYQLDLSSRTFKESHFGGGTSLCFNCFGPAILVLHGKDAAPYAPEPTAPFTASMDGGGNFLLFEDRTLPAEMTALVDCRQSGAIKARVFVERISGGSGETKVEYRGADLVTAFRFLPGEYRVDVSLREGKRSLATVQSGIRSMTLNAEAGRTYRIHLTIESAGTKFSNDVVGNTQMQTAFKWDAAFEDVTGQTLDDQ